MLSAALNMRKWFSMMNSHTKQFSLAIFLAACLVASCGAQKDTGTAKPKAEPKTEPKTEQKTQTTADGIVVSAVGDVMLGTTFPDASGSDLPPNDGADLLQEVTPVLKRADVTFGN